MDTNQVLPESSEFLHKRSLTDEVYDYLYRKIIAGSFSPGDWLRQEDISTQLGVSQTPVREALDRLSSSGLVERVPYRGVRVVIMESKEILDAFLLRLAIENLAARLIANNISPSELNTLSEIVEQTANLITLEDMTTLRQLNNEFHKRLVDLADNPLLSKMYVMVTNSFPDWMLYEYMFRHPELLQTSLRREYLEHRAIVDALASHDPESTSVQVVNHLINLVDELRTYLNISADLIEQTEGQIQTILASSNKK